MSKKLITYVITISTLFPKTHPRKGDSTDFEPRILYKLKKHTIRHNYELWRKRFLKIDAGIACLSVRVWSAEPYKSKQVELFRFKKSDDIGLEKLENPDNMLFASINGSQVNWETVAKNDGLTFIDFCNWFKVRNNEPMAIIHFTNFRYCKS